MLRAALLLAPLALLTGVAQAQTCVPSMTYADCDAALQKEYDSKGVAPTAARVNHDLDTINTGSQTGANTATDDFNPKLQVSADTLGVTGENGDAVTLSWSDFFAQRVRKQLFGDDGRAESVGQHHKLIVSLQEAKLFEPLKQAITDQKVVEDLQDSLDDFDDVLADLRFSLNSERRGRDLQQQQGLIVAIQDAAVADVKTKRDQAVRNTDNEDKILQRHNFDATRPINANMNAAEADSLLQAMRDSFTAQLDYEAAYVDAARKHGLFDLVDLVNNQPQLLLSAQGRIRDDLVGPDEYSLKLTYEMGGANVNGFRRYQQEQTAKPAAEQTCRSDLECLAKYVDLNRDVIRAGNRLAFSLAYVSKESYRFDGSGVSLSFDSERSLIAELDYGRYVNTGLTGLGLDGRSRIDLTASYEDVSGDPARQNRAIAKATFAQEIGSGLFLTVGLAWANKPEFRGDVDEEISARAGISYKLAPHGEKR